ncbi:family 16 glycosylhydrolase [Microvirga sp. 2TAF3]|uniref:family 16 glycosylhydrolase n=1 Tax=Microvirga sp. 2TAF3 TaxID=3233014 RepID=UPI003F96E11F
MSIDPLSLSVSAILTFSEEFDAFSYWNGATGRWGTGYPWTAPNGGTNATNGEEQWYVNANYAPTSGLGTYSVNDGVFSITAARASAEIQSRINGYDYTSGMIMTFHSFSQTYGYFEIKAKLPAGQGLWPAFWLLPTDMSWPPEIDIMEVIGSEPNTLNTTVHYGSNLQRGAEIHAADMTTGFHTYGVDWQQNTITWYYDGQKVFQTATPADMHKPMYMLANLAVGGEWPGSPDATTTFPAKMDIDYIRAYSAKPGVGPETPASAWTADPQQKPFILKISTKAKKTIAGTYEWDKLNGTSTHDKIIGKQGGDTMRGYKGDDTYYVENYADKVIEKSKMGIDTVRTDLAAYRLPANVENLELDGKGDQRGIGNSLNNRIVSNGGGDNRLEGGAGNDHLYAGRYADTLIGGAGRDQFIFKSAPVRAGHIKDFKPGIDVLDLRGLFKGYKGTDPVAEGLLFFDGDQLGNTVVKYRAGSGPIVTITTLDKVSPDALHAQADYFFV